jgi:hypothetical protein
MSDETRRPNSGNAGEIPTGVRARNRTMVLGSEKVGPLRSSLERPAPVIATPSHEAPTSAHENSVFDPFEGDEYVSLTKDDDSLQSLDEIFGLPHGKADASSNVPAPTLDDPFAFDDTAERDASSTIMGAGGLEDDFAAVTDLLEPTEVPPAPTASQPAPPRIVRSTTTIALPASPPPQPVTHDDDLDPFAAMQDDAISQPPPITPPALFDDLDGALGGIPEMEELPVVQSAPVGAPKIVRPGEGGGAHERSIAVPPPPQPAPQVHPVTEVSKAPKEAEAMTEPRDRIYWKTDSPLVGFLVTYDHDPKGSYVELRQGRLMVSNQREESGSCLVVVGESVSPMHAIMRVASGGIVQVLDQLSEAGTRVRHMGQPEEEFLSGEKSTLSHGDSVFFGDRKFHVLLVVGED